MESITNPWPWYVAGPLIALTMALLLFLNKSFGVSSNLRTLCAIGGADRLNDFFKINVRQDLWNLVFVAGAAVGGFLAANFLMTPDALRFGASTIQELDALNFKQPDNAYLPAELFQFSGWGIGLMIAGGFLVGFGARYAGGCTSGHAISGISNLQIPSLIAVIGFFIGGLIMTHLLFPLIF